ncbi:MAG: hypothetical protein ACK52I_11805 [Pseudomonadota bacterium]
MLELVVGGGGRAPGAMLGPWSCRRRRDLVDLGPGRSTSSLGSCCVVVTRSDETIAAALPSARRVPLSCRALPGCSSSFAGQGRAPGAPLVAGRAVVLRPIELGPRARRPRWALWLRAVTRSGEAF